MIFTIIVITLFVFKAPKFTWVGVLICFGYFFLKSMVKNGLPQQQHDEFDEFDWWQDDQGL